LGNEAKIMTLQHEADPKKDIPPPLSRNLISYIGWIITCIISVILLILILADFLYHRESPYNSLVTYLILPMFLLGGVSLIWLGILVEWHRRHKLSPEEYFSFPTIDFNKPWQRRRVVIGSVLVALLFAFSAVGTYRAYNFTESVAFCGQLCHAVMRPEYTAYKFSPHARVRCTECHIGAGASWYVKSKLSGLYQVWATLTHIYHTPIPTPLENLRPARETCEECHWPEKFSGDMEKEIWHFSPDQANTPTRYNLLLKIGGGTPEAGLGQGIHWHINSTVRVRYWARDKTRLDIPWVEVTIGTSAPVVYRSPDCPDPLPEEAEIRLMDCIDCHNRPSHIFRSPRQLIDTSLAAGVLDPSLPYLKRYATELLERQYPDTPTALKSIASILKTRNKDWMQGPRGTALVQHNIEWLQTVYQRNFFPEQGVDWRQYPDHKGHFEFPGCYRCHDGRHRNAEDKKISNDCQLCHEIIDQAEGEKAFAPITYTPGPFRHPRNLGDIWKGNNCTDCHGLTASRAGKASSLPQQQ
jgi:hypothetical protein